MELKTTQKAKMRLREAREFFEELSSNTHFLKTILEKTFPEREDIPGLNYSEVTRLIDASELSSIMKQVNDISEKLDQVDALLSDIGYEASSVAYIAFVLGSRIETVEKLEANGQADIPRKIRKLKRVKDLIEQDAEQ